MNTLAFFVELLALGFLLAGYWWVALPVGLLGLVLLP
jgi:hypothetical protein